MVPLGDLVAKAMRRTPAKVSFQTMSTLCKFFTHFLTSGDQHLIQELVDLHAVKVNPGNLVISTQFFNTLVSEENLKDAPHLRFYLLLAM